MWLAPFVKPERAASGRGSEAAVTGNIIKIDLETRIPGGRGLPHLELQQESRGSEEDAVRGVKEFSVYCDDRYVAAFLCRKAPGHVNFDFKQVVLLDQPPCDAVRRPGALPPAPRVPSRGRGGRPPTGTPDRIWRWRARALLLQDLGTAPARPRKSGRAPAGRRRPPALAPARRPAGRSSRTYETPLHPCGFVFKLLLLDTWSDVHYVGLDGVELYDLEGRPLRPKRVHSSRGSVRDLPGMENDSRTEESLLHGAPGTSGRMWLAPFARHPPNSVELVFDEPTQISAVHIWNYTRTTPSRGVRDVEIYVDDLLIYQGILRQRTPGGDAAGRAAAGRCGEAVLFTALPEIVEREKPFVYLPSADELVAFFDERGRLDQGGGCPGDALLVRPMTAVTRAP
ncbi:unnamed protein product [Prorocentrum cordatum]|uniref:KATNIP domain-containing protein n=1 Tax=Prorocentrum cordatum TaxID=2364126 RepID=A0ABN9UU63_9DINO|nr:unnamed protein product [Polarella glacialis]